MKTKSMLLLGLTSFVLSDCASPHHVTAWEYKIVPSGNNNVNVAPPPDWQTKQEEMLDSLGKDGWILINESDGYFYLRRPAR